MARKRITRRLSPLPKRPVFRGDEDPEKQLFGLLRNVAMQSQRPEPQLFYSRREVALRFKVPISQAAKMYRLLEEEGILRPLRGSGTILEGLDPGHRTVTRGIVAVVSSLSRFLTQQDYRMFCLQMNRELQRRNFTSAGALFDLCESGDELAVRLKGCRAHQVVWYAPKRLCKEVALRMHDAGVSMIGVADGGFAAMPCQYEVRRQPALVEIVEQWKRDEEITRVRVALGPTRSAADEATIGGTLEEMKIQVQFVSLGLQTIRQFIDSLVRNPTAGMVISQSAASLLALYSPDIFAHLAKVSRLALMGGPVSVPYARFPEAMVDLVTINWRPVVSRIVDDLSKPRSPVLQPQIFEATAQCRVALSSYAQRI